MPDSLSHPCGRDRDFKDGILTVQLDIRKKFNINILGTKCGSKLDSFITPDTLLCEGKSLMVMGKYKDIQKCFRI